MASREPSEDRWAKKYQRQIPVPNFVPTERTSTASFKAPVTIKKEKAPAPPPPGTLSSAMSYLSSPVKYFSSMFSAPPPADTNKPKDKVFKIDLERETQKEKAKFKPPAHASPPVSVTLNKVTKIPSETVQPQTQKVSSNIGETEGRSRWRERNMREQGMAAQQLTSPVRNRSPSKRASSGHGPIAPDQSPQLNQIKFNASVNKNSFRIMSKMQPQEEPENNVMGKKETRTWNGKPMKDVPIPNHVNSMASRFSHMNPTLLDESSQLPPIMPYPTLIPPRVPPATYTIRSAPDEPGAIEKVLNVAAPIDTPKVEKPSMNLPFGIHHDSELGVEEMLGGMDHSLRVMRLDQFVPGSSGIGSLEGKVGHLVPDPTLVNAHKDVPKLEVMLCGSPIFPVPALHSHTGAKSTEMIVRDISMSPLTKSLSPDASQVYSEAKSTAIKLTTANNTNASALKHRQKQKDEQMEDEHNTNRIRKNNYSKRNGRPVSPFAKRFKKRESSKAAVKENGQNKSCPNKTKPEPKTLNKGGGEHSSQKLIKKVYTKKKIPTPENIEPTRKSTSPKPPFRSKSPAGQNKVVSPKPPRSPKRAASPAKSDPAGSFIDAALGAAVGSTAGSIIGAVIKSDQKMEKPNPEQPVAPHHTPPYSWKFENESMLKVPEEPTKTPKHPEVETTVANHPAAKLLAPTKMEKAASKATKVNPETTSSGRSKQVCAEGDEMNCLENYCGHPAKFARASTMMGEFP